MTGSFLTQNQKVSSIARAGLVGRSVGKGRADKIRPATYLRSAACPTCSAGGTYTRTTVRTHSYPTQQPTELLFGFFVMMFALVSLLSQVSLYPQGASSTPICGSETFGQGFDSTQLTLHGNGYTLEHMPKKTVFFVNDTFETSCGNLPLCVRETKSCDVEEMMFATMVKADSAKYLSEGMQLDVEISVTTGALLWESTSTMTQSYSENLKYLETHESIVVMQGGYGHTWSGSCSVRDQSVSYSDSFAKLLVQIANLPLELSSSVADETIDTFGTAVATGGYFGGTYITTFYSTHDLYAAFLSASASGDQGIHDSGYFWSVGGTASTMKETADGILWEKSYLHRYSSSLGVTPPADGSSYVKAIGNNCVPTRLELLPLHSLVQLKGIEGLDSSEVKFVVSQLQDAEIRYCYEIGICGSTPTPQPTKAPDLFGGLYWVKDCGGGDQSLHEKF
jgi:hypothetical protein